jgi:molybdate transport system substrate-binding protein
MFRLVTVLILLAAAGPVSTVGHAPAIIVAAAVSLTDALTAAAREAPGFDADQIHFNFAASNVLARQIVNGAPVDLFISADEAQMDVVATAGMLADGTRIDLLTNQLAVVVPDDRPRTFAGIRDLLDPAFKRIALGDPAAVPAGVYAKSYLENAGLWGSLQPRVVPTVSVRAALAAVDSGAADAAIVYRTDAQVARRARIAWLVPVDRGPRICYPAALIKRNAAPAEAKRFLDFLRSDGGSRVFQRFGFSPVPSGR